MFRISWVKYKNGKWCGKSHKIHYDLQQYINEYKNFKPEI